MATRTKLYVDHVDAFLLEQPSLILRRHRLKGRLLPLVLDRQRLADSLAKLLGQLGLERQAPNTPDLGAFLARYGNREAAGANGAAPPDPSSRPSTTDKREGGS